MGSGGKKRKGRKHLPKVRGNPDPLATGNQSRIGGAYGQRPWGIGGSRQRAQWSPLGVIGWLIVGFVAVVVVVRLATG